MVASVPLLATRNLTKDYPGVRALDGVDFDLRAGEVHALLGENGTGKSTLISMLSGAAAPSAGHIERDGQAVAFSSVHDARDRGVSAVFQEFSLIPQMTVEENMFLGAEHRRGIFLDRAEMRRETERILSELAFDLKPGRKVRDMSRAEQQMVEIAKAFRSELSVLILDEPTASLTSHEAEQLFRLADDLTTRGVGIIYITHRMEEIFRIGDRITVLRDGRYVDTVGIDEADEDRLVELMTGSGVGATFPAGAAAASGQEEILRLDGVSTHGGGARDVSLSIRRGEIIGLAGLVGSGKSEAMRAAFGALPISAGRVIYKGEEVTGRSPGDAIGNGFLYLPADRREEGLLMVRPVRENMSLASLGGERFRRGIFVDRAWERRVVAETSECLNLSPNRPEMTVDRLSGGNQQKVMLARSLICDIDLVILDEPTVGVDVGTRHAIYRFIVDLAEGGAAVVIVSSDLSEILNLADRAYVFHRGHIQAEFCGGDLTEENVLARFFGKESA